MDDFGTGDASLSHLRRFPSDKIEIDQSFVSGMVAGDGSTHIVGSMTGLADRLDLLTCAEGVETLQQAPSLAGMVVRAAAGPLVRAPRARRGPGGVVTDAGARPRLAA